MDTSFIIIAVLAAAVLGALIDYLLNKLQILPDNPKLTHIIAVIAFCIVFIIVASLPEIRAALSSTEDIVVSSTDSLESGSTLDPYFTSENILMNTCVYAVSKGMDDIEWEVVSNRTHKIQTAKGEVSLDIEPTSVLSALLMAPRAIIINEVSVFLENTDDPIELTRADIYATCLAEGGGPVSNMLFRPLKLNRSDIVYKLVPETQLGIVPLPYHLDEREALVLKVPLAPLESASYTIRVGANVIDFEGKELILTSRPLEFGYLQVSPKDLEGLEITVP